MSLIADALKKAEKQQQFGSAAAASVPPPLSQGKPPKKNNGPWLLLVLILILTAAAAAFGLWTQARKPLPAAVQATIIPEPPPPPAEKPVAVESPEPIEEMPPAELPPQKPPAPALSLTGIVRGTSAKDSLALINNKTLREGDRIEGFTVSSIREKEVELRDESGEVRLLSY